MKSPDLKPIKFYVLADDYEMLKREAEDHGVSLSFFCAQLIRQYSPVKLGDVAKRGAPAGNRNAAGLRTDGNAEQSTVD